MPYYGTYRGDYRTYGYGGRGDPGFLSNLWKGIKKVAAPVVGGLIGGPIGAVVGGLGGGIGTPPILPMGTSQPMPRQQLRVGPIVSTDYFPPAPVGPSKPLPPARLGGRGGVVSMNGCAPSGYHLAKDGSGRMVRNRRMNPANPKALRRAIRRTDGFVKLAKRALKGTGYAVRRA